MAFLKFNSPIEYLKLFDMNESTPNTPTPSPIKTNKSIGTLLKELWQATFQWFKDLLNLKEGANQEEMIKLEIRNNKKIRGSNAWLLMCSIMIASLGLDLDSPAIIIGAMLISPLMSPILGLGLGVALNDKKSLFIALQHFFVAILIALITSTLYFVVTPFGQLTPEIKARTAPTLLDGLVAVFGGLAGIISITRKNPSNAIPGVAIATALMPPLCVTGYGIANWNMTILLNSFYLFFLNSFFIALTAFIIIKLLNFEPTTYDPKEERRTRLLLIFFSLLLILPSAKILYDLYNQRQEFLKAQTFVNEMFPKTGQTRCRGHEFLTPDTSSTQRLLILELLGKPLPEDSIKKLERKLPDYGIENTRLSLIQNTNLGLEQLNLMQLELNNLGQIADKLENVNEAKSQQEIELERLKARLDSIASDTIPFARVCREAKIVFPKLEKVSYARTQQNDFNGHISEVPVFLIKWAADKTRYERTLDEQKLYNLLKVSTELDTLQMIPY
jgi:uncharacterized hydrophobic protein (TIGR00271 family)